MADTKVAERRISGVVPIGGCIPFFDFGGIVTFDTDEWAYMDGTVLNDPDSPLDGQTLTDLSNRYIVGFGTEGGGDIDTTPWNAAPVGNASHLINLAHTHTVNSHSHTVNSHNHTVISHSHTLPNYTKEIANDSGLSFGGSFYAVNSSGYEGIVDITTNDANSGEGDHRHIIGGDTGLSSPDTTSNAPGTDSQSPGTSSASPDTNSQLSSAQTIQPRSVRARMIIRIK